VGTHGIETTGVDVKQQEQTCPRCGKTVIDVKDWGKAGKLFVHSTSTENGISVKDAHHVHADELSDGLRWTVQL
jgi:hypothetical protein